MGGKGFGGTCSVVAWSGNSKCAIWLLRLVQRCINFRMQWLLLLVLGLLYRRGSSNPGRALVMQRVLHPLS
jgi:hypothetical protein